MPVQETPLVPDDVLEDNDSPLGALRAVKKPLKTVREGKKVEPSMRKYCRIMEVLPSDLFPDGFTALVDQLFGAHTADLEAWAEAEYESESERDDSLDLLRLYAECAGEKGYTIRVDYDTEPTIARFRVTARRGSADK